MAERTINLNNFKSSGVYTVEIDQSENVALPLTTGRLVVGSSRVGPFNTVVLINDVRTLNAVFGTIDTKLEKAGSYFHRSIEVALREGPVFALNVMPLDGTEGSANLDKAFFTTFNTESSAHNNTTGPLQSPMINFFNKRRLWFASSEFLNRTKNLDLGDDFVTNPGGLGMVSAPSNKILSFCNTGKTNATVWVRRANVSGFDITAKEWYSTVGADLEFPTYLHPDDFIADYMVEVMMVQGDWTNYLKLSKDPTYAQYFSPSGLKDDKSTDFFALREIKVINRTVGCLLPDFIDQSGNSISIDRLINRLFPSTGILCALDTDKLDLIDLETSAFIDSEVDTHRVDIVGHGYDDITKYADDGDSAVAATPLIDAISYSKPADGTLIYKEVNTITEAQLIAGGTLASGEIRKVTATASGSDYYAAASGSTAYSSFKSGFIVSGDEILNGSNTIIGYAKFTDNLTSGTLDYISIESYSDASLLNLQNAVSYGAGDHFRINAEEKDFKQEFDLSDTNYFTDFQINQPNELVLGIETATPANKALVDEFIKVNHYIKGNAIGSTRTKLYKIISVKSKETLSPYRLEYTVTTMAPTVDEISGIELATGNTISVYKGIHNFVDDLKGQYLAGFKLRNELLPNGTASRQQDILGYLFDFTSIPQALAGKEVIDFRYVVDTYEGDISSSSKYYLAKLAAMHGQAMALLNSPSIEQFEKSVDPSFIDSSNKLVSARLISEGGDLNLNPSFTFKFAEEDVNGVPLSSYSNFTFPNLIIRNGNRNLSVPPSAYISNLYVRKFKNGTPFMIVAGGKRGVITDPELVGVEYELTNEDRDFLEPVGHNLIVKRRGFGILLFSNNTAYQKINSALNNAHVRDNLSTIEKDLARILFNFLFDFNDEITRLRVKTIVENYLDSVVAARGLSSYEVIFDASNNTTEVIENNSAIIDVLVNFPRGIHKFINRITITRADGQLSSDSTGFTPSF